MSAYRFFIPHLIRADDIWKETRIDGTKPNKKQMKIDNNKKKKQSAYNCLLSDYPEIKNEKGEKMRKIVKFYHNKRSQDNENE